MPPRPIEPMIKEELFDCDPVDFGQGVVVDQICSTYGAQQVNVAIDGYHSRKTMLFKAPSALIKKHFTENYGNILRPMASGLCKFDSSEVILLIRKKDTGKFILVFDGAVRRDVLDSFQVEVL